jgi:transcriptional regulator with AAA-type ATPase domain
MGYSGNASAEEMVSLLSLTSHAVRRGAVGEPLAWAVEHLGLEALVVLYRDQDDGVSMVSSAGDLGPLMRSADALTAMALEQQGPHAGTRITQLSDHGESLLVAPMRRQHVLIVRFAGSPPAVGDLRAVIASVEAVLCSGNPPQPAPAAPGERRDPELRRFGSPLNRIAGLSDAINECKRRTAELSQSDRAVLIAGEAGTGKSLFARVIHDLSGRHGGTFVVDGGGSPAESGNEVERLRAAVAEARGGTLYVRDLAAVSRSGQDVLVELLRPTATGASDPSVDVRALLGVVGDAAVAREQGLLAEELAAALGGFRLSLPPLRDRPEDIPLLLTHFQREAGGRGRRAGSGFTVDALEALASYHWPENVKELRAEVLRLMTRAHSDMIVELADLSPAIREAIAADGVVSPDLGALVSRPLSAARAEFERWMILRALHEEDWNQTRAADRLGLSRAGLFKKMRKLELTNRGPGE